MSTAVQANLVDRSAERTAVRIPTIPGTPANMATIVAFEQGLEAQLADLSLLAFAGTSVNTVNKQAYSLPDGENAHREVAVRFVMEDVDQNQASFSIGGPDLSQFPFVTGPGGDIFEWNPAGAGAALADFVSDVLVVARHPISGGVMTMKRLVLIGRSN